MSDHAQSVSGLKMFTITLKKVKVMRTIPNAWFRTSTETGSIVWCLLFCLVDVHRYLSVMTTDMALGARVAAILVVLFLIHPFVDSISWRRWPTGPVEILSIGPPECAKSQSAVLARSVAQVVASSSPGYLLPLPGEQCCENSSNALHHSALLQTPIAPPTPTPPTQPAAASSWSRVS